MLIFVHMHFLSHCNRKALVQFSCPTQGRFWVQNLHHWVLCCHFIFLSLGGFIVRKWVKGRGEKGRDEKRRREEFSAMLNLDSRLCLHSWLVFQNFSLNALVFLQFHVVMALCTYTLESKITIITYNIRHQFGLNKHLKLGFLIFLIFITSSSPAVITGLTW